ncbi:MAG: hypothetical protein CL867_06135 [Cytophagaceae bacterium]|nr:hypothetical protein [Cytophagaceae bacterium]
MKTKDVQLSPDFRRQATKAIQSIVFFIMSYVILLVLAVALTFLCVFGSIALMSAKPSLITLVVGIGLASVGILVLLFLIKFIFKSNKVDRSNLIEVNRAEQPQLFAMLDDIVEKVGTDFPKKVYLSAEVNASVFYDSSFWSMIFPVRKNLSIGMGLINTISASELKAILAHEFGHFSQKTMKVSSYVYYVNQVIFNLLNDNDNYHNLVHRWANIHGIFALFVLLAQKVIEGIQKTLRYLYGIVNKNYLSLSREMEFHADEIAASITGYEPLKTSLLRMQLADISFNEVLSFYEDKIKENLKSQNIYKEHTYVLHFFAKENKLPIIQGIPYIKEEELNKLNKSKLNIEDQWASHPSTEDRIERLEKTTWATIDTPHIHANDIIQNLEQLQHACTQKLFKVVVYQGEVSEITLEAFKEAHQEIYNSNVFAKAYNSYYDHKNPIGFDLKDIAQSTQKLDFETLFGPDKIDMVYTAVALDNDILILKQIAANELPVKTFDYDGKKYKKSESKALQNQLKTQYEDVQASIKENDKAIYSYYLQLEQQLDHTPRLKAYYQEFFAFDHDFNAKFEVYTAMMNQLIFTNEITPPEDIILNFDRLKSYEHKLKTHLKSILEDELYTSELTPDIRSSFEKYLEKQWVYFNKDQYLERHLEILSAALNNFAFIYSRGYFLLKKKVLDYQEQLRSQHLATVEI